MSVSIDQLEDLVERSDKLITGLKKKIFTPTGAKQFNKLFKISEAARLIDRHPQTIREAEKQGHIKVERAEGTNARDFTLEQLNAARKHFGSEPRLGRDEEAAVLAVQNFKGGVGKSTISVHLAQWLAIQGYRVLLIDLDSQASSTSLFGYTPDIDIDPDDTLLPFFEGQQRTMHYAIRDTQIENLSLIPANLSLYSAEYLVASKHTSSPIYSHLPRGIQDLKKDYEVIILDPPPALGMLSINALVAATSLLVPMPPRMLDFTSSLQFFSMLHETLESIEEDLGQAIEYDFVKIVASKKKQRLGDEKYARAEDDILEIARDMAFGDEYMLKNVIYESSAIDNAANKFKSLYEVDGKDARTKSFRSALKSMDLVCEEVQQELIKLWPSMQGKLKQTEAELA